MSAANQSNKEVAQMLAHNDHFIEEVAQMLAHNDHFIEEVAPKLEEKLPRNEELITKLAVEFIKQTFNPQRISEFKPEVVIKSLSKEKRRWVWLSLALAIVSLVIMIGVYGLSLRLGGADAIKTLAVPLISAFCLVVLVINVAFNMTVFRVTR